MTIKRRLVLLGVFANALLLLLVAIAAVATPDTHAERAALLLPSIAATILVPVDVALGWVLCTTRSAKAGHRARATV